MLTIISPDSELDGMEIPETREEAQGRIGELLDSVQDIAQELVDLIEPIEPMARMWTRDIMDRLEKRLIEIQLNINKLSRHD